MFNTDRCRHIRHGLFRIDSLEPFIDIGRAMQPLQRYVDKIRIAIVKFTVRKDAFDDLNQQMEIVCAVLAQSVQAGLFHHEQRLNQGWPLTPRPTGEKFEIAPAPLDGRSDFTAEIGEIITREITAFAFHVRDDALGNVADIKCRPGRFQPGFTSEMSSRLLLIDHELDCYCQIRL